MSKRKIPPPARGYTGRWNHDRFIAALKSQGITEPKQLRDLLTAHRERTGDTDVVQIRSCRRWMSGESDPSLGAGGRQPYAFELSLALGVSLEWLLTGGKP